MVELPGQPQRAETLGQPAGGVSEEPRGPARDLPAADAGIVPAVKEGVAMVAGLVVERHPLLQMGPRRPGLAEPDQHWPQGMVPLEEQGRVAVTLGEGEELPSQIERGARARARSEQRRVGKTPRVRGTECVDAC